MVCSAGFERSHAQGRWGHLRWQARTTRRVRWPNFNFLVWSIRFLTIAMPFRIVEFASKSDMKNALKKCDGMEVGGRRIRVTEERGSRSRSASRSRSRTPARKRSETRSRSRTRSRSWAGTWPMYQPPDYDQPERKPCDWGVMVFFVFFCHRCVFIWSMRSSSFVASCVAPCMFVHCSRSIVFSGCS